MVTGMQCFPPKTTRKPITLTQQVTFIGVSHIVNFAFVSTNFTSQTYESFCSLYFMVIVQVT